MQRKLTSKFVAGSTTFLLVVVVFAMVIVINIRQVRDLVEVLTDQRISSVRLAGSYHAEMQRLLMETAMYVYTDNPEELEEAEDTIERLDEIVTALQMVESAESILHPDLAVERDELHQNRTKLFTDVQQQVKYIKRLNSIDHPAAMVKVADLVESFEDEDRELKGRFTSYLVDEHNFVMSQTTGQAHTALASIGGAVGGIIVMICLGLWLLNRQIVRPVQTLSQASVVVTEGNLEQIVPVTNRDEIGTLQQAFNQMVTTLRQRTSDLEAQNTEATVARDEATTAQEVAETAHRQIATQLEIIQHQQDMIRDLSVPILPLTATTLVMPLVGAIDSQRAQQIMDRLLEGIAVQQATIAIVDITGVQIIDTHVAGVLIQLAQAVKLLGAQLVLTGIRPDIAQTIVQLGIDLNSMITRSSLQSGITYALGKLGG